MMGIQPATRITMISAGTPKRIQLYSQVGNFRPSPLFASSRKFFQPQPFLLTQNMMKISEPMGRMLFETMKSSRPSIVPPMGRYVPSSGFMPKMAGSAKTSMPTHVTMELFLRLHPHWSMPNAIRFSNTAITVESAANDMNRKNSVPHSWPSGICSKMLGSVMNASPAPEPGSTPNAKQAGKMIRPASSATAVSRMPTVVASPKRLRSLPM